jgi:hypothetical protein
MAAALILDAGLAIAAVTVVLSGCLSRLLVVFAAAAVAAAAAPPPPRAFPRAIVSARALSKALTEVFDLCGNGLVPPESSRSTKSPYFTF